ncbi:response regulator [Maridesulfovibrio bastinii]|uniref:response regulator n=1 Tax=Maridesulfovibrio bastinii TaxID=47157 RepID=UPI00041B9D32|nr:response regulator transcription factor [Maridesulfovibrio bastinii]
MYNQVKVLIVDDHALVREGLKTILANQSGIQVVGTAGDGDEAILLYERLEPDVVLMDLSMPVKDGVQAMRELLKLGKNTRVLALTAHVDQDHIFSALDAGACGYLLKNSTRDELVMAIQTVMEGKVYLAPGISGEVAKGFLRVARDTTGGKLGNLTDREKEVFRLVAEGYKNREIADLLIISIKTVEKHRSNLMKKLGLKSAAEVKCLWSELHNS